jgi:branched-chain amino acid transport system substrate-binding protein
MINERGGVNGRKIRLISLDDAYSPPKTVEQTRKLVEQEQVLFIFGSLGTPTNTAIQKYLNANKVPHLFVATGATKFRDPQHFPWTIGWPPSYQTEARIYGKYLLQNRPNAKIAVLYQNDDYGKDYLKGLKDGLGETGARMVVTEVTYEVTDPTVDSQIITLKATGADIFVDIASPKFAAQAIRKTHDIGWKPLHVLNNVSDSISAVLEPAGLDKSVGLISARYFKDQTDPEWQNDSGVKDFLAWMKAYYPEGDPADRYNVTGYSVAQTLVAVLKQCGDDLTRENVMRQATNIKSLELPMLLPGIKLNTSATNYRPIRQLKLARFDGKHWVGFGGVIED